jgi:hypothetical protein
MRVRSLLDFQRQQPKVGSVATLNSNLQLHELSGLPASREPVVPSYQRASILHDAATVRARDTNWAMEGQGKAAVFELRFRSAEWIAVPS